MISKFSSSNLSSFFSKSYPYIFPLQSRATALKELHVVLVNDQADHPERGKAGHRIIVETRVYRKRQTHTTVDIVKIDNTISPKKRILLSISLPSLLLVRFNWTAGTADDYHSKSTSTLSYSFVPYELF